MKPVIIEHLRGEVILAAEGWANWLRLSPNEADDIAALLSKHAEEARKHPAHRAICGNALTPTPRPAGARWPAPRG